MQFLQLRSTVKYACACLRQDSKTVAMYRLLPVLRISYELRLFTAGSIEKRGPETLALSAGSGHLSQSRLLLLPLVKSKY